MSLILLSTFLFPGPCSFSDCEEYYGTCTVAQDGSGTAQCECPLAEECSSGVRAVCGDNGKTYPNRCRLEAESCEIKKRIEVKDRGQCSKFRICFHKCPTLGFHPQPRNVKLPSA